MSSRIYKVTAVYGDGDDVNAKTFLVDAASPGQARTYVAKKFLTTEIAKPRDIVAFMADGGKVEVTDNE